MVHFLLSDLMMEAYIEALEAAGLVEGTNFIINEVEVNAAEDFLGIMW